MLIFLVRGFFVVVVVVVVDVVVVVFVAGFSMQILQKKEISIVLASATCVVLFSFFSLSFSLKQHESK